MDGLVLSIEVIHVRNQVTKDVHMREGIDLGVLRSIGIDFAESEGRVFSTALDD